MKKYVAMVILPTVVFGSFTPGKEMDNNLFIPTPYTLNKGEWQIGIGPVWYGIIDNFMVGTNILSWLFLNINVGAKFNLLNENKGAPLGLGIVGNFSQFRLLDLTWTSFGGGIAVGKKIMKPDGGTRKGESNIYIAGTFSQISFSGDTGDTTVTWSSPTGTQISGGFDYFTSENIRISGDVIYTFPQTIEDIEVEGMFWFGGGLHIAWKNFNLKLGVGTSPELLSSDIPLKFLPVINLYWRFGGKPPTGN